MPGTWRSLARILTLALHGCRLQFGAVLAGSVLGSTFALLPPYLLGNFLNVLVAAPQLGLARAQAGMNALILAIVASVLASNGVGYLTSRAVMWVNGKATLGLRERVHEAVLRMSLGARAAFDSGAIKYRIADDTGQLQQFVGAIVPSLATNLALIAGGLLLVLIRAPFMSAIVIVPAAMLAVGTYVVRRISARLYAGEVSTSTAVWTRLHELVGGAKAIRLFGREAHQQALFSEAADALRRTQDRSSLVNTNYGTALALTSAACTYLLYYFGGLRVIAPAAQMKVGDLVGLVPIAMFLFGPLNAVSGMLGQIYKSKTAAERLCELLDAPAESGGDVPEFVPPPGALVVHEVRFGYEPQREVLHGLSLRVEPGELVALTGPSGAGKTTTLNLLCRLYEPHDGTISWGGVQARAIDPRAWRRAIGVVMQETYLFKESLAENIRCGRPWIGDAQVARAAALAGVDRFLDDLPAGYETALGDGGTELSGGQRQRIGIARALAADPPLLILDEPTSALDSETEAVFLDALEGVVRRKMGIVIAHRPTTIARADRVVRLEAGRVVDGVVA